MNWRRRPPEHAGVEARRVHGDRIARAGRSRRRHLGGPVERLPPQETERISIGGTNGIFDIPLVFGTPARPPETACGLMPRGRHRGAGPAISRRRAICRSEIRDRVDVPWQSRGREPRDGLADARRVELGARPTGAATDEDRVVLRSTETAPFVQPRWEPPRKATRSLCAWTSCYCLQALQSAIRLRLRRQ